MLKKKKSNVIRKIMKFAKLANLEMNYSVQLKTKITSLLKILNDEQLDILLMCLQSKGGIDADCICIGNDTKIVTRQAELRYAMAEAFRFPGISRESFLKNLICCSQNNSCTPFDQHCLNPFHVSLVVEVDSPLPPYSESQATTETCVTPPSVAKESISLTASSPSCSGSCASSSECAMIVDDHLKSDKPWCRLTYWEMKDRIGPIFDAFLPCINVFENLPQGHGLCLSLLNSGNIVRSERSKKIRDSIGYGFQLTKEHDGVWLYNHSGIVLFVGSSTFQVKTVTQPVVKRVEPGHSVLVHSQFIVPVDSNKSFNDKSRDSTNGSNPDKAISSPSETAASAITKSRIEPYCVRVSFGKGWGGSNYSRMSISQCPCWIEMYLNV